MIGPAISASGTTQILVATKPVDFRKHADSLAALVQEALGADPFSGVVYVFRAKRIELFEGVPVHPLLVPHPSPLSHKDRVQAEIAELLAYHRRCGADEPWIAAGLTREAC
jgi:hypothetical protein